MKSYSQFLNEAVEGAQNAWAQWLKNNPKATAPGGKFYNTDDLNKAAREFMKTYQKTGKTPGWASSGGGTTPPPPPPSSATPPKAEAPKPPVQSTSLATKPKFRIPRPTAGQAAVGALNVGLGALEYKQRRDAGQTRVQAGSGAVSSAAGGQSGWMLGAKGGAALGSKLAGPRGALVGGVVGGITGSVVGSSGASALSDKLTGVTPKAPTEKDYEKARQKVGTTAARQVAAKSNVYGARSGSAVVGTGAKTQTKAQLPKTMLLPGGKVGDLAYRGGKPVYLARASVASRDVGLGGALRNISRTTGIGGQRERDAAATKREYRTALASTQKYYKDIGVKNPAKVTLKPTGNLPARPLPGYGKTKK